MCGKRSCGKMADIPRTIPLKDTRTGTHRKVQTGANLVGNSASLQDKRGMNQQPLKVRNPLNGKG